MLTAGGAAVVGEISPRAAAQIRARVESGRYPDATAVVDEALRALDEKDRIERLRALVEVAQAEVARGEVADWSPELFARLKREATQARLAGTPIPDEVRP